MSIFEQFINKLKRLLPSRICNDCDGRGRWQDSKLTADGIIEISTYYCETCHGHGIKTNDDEIDDFDLGGVGVTEFDDDDEDTI